MPENDFWFLCALLREHMGEPAFPSETSTKKHRNGARNGIIRCTTRVSAALRYMAGGSVYDIAVVHGISITQVYESVWTVVEAINKCEELSFEFPTTHEEQRKLAKGFQELSDADFDICVWELLMGYLFGLSSQVVLTVRGLCVDRRSSFAVERRNLG